MRTGERSKGAAWRCVAGGIVVLAGCQGDGFFCGGGDCGQSDSEKAALISLGGLPTEAPGDPTNAFQRDPGAIALGRMFFFDTRFAGNGVLTDALGRPVPFGRGPKGQPSAVACATCHDFTRAGVDPSPAPGNVSSGAAWTFNNAPSVFNAAFYQLHTWSGKLDSLWSQAMADSENWMTTNGNRLRTAWLISEIYRDQYEKVFDDPAKAHQYPLPIEGKLADWQARVVEAGTPLAGQCNLMGTTCPSYCREVTSTTTGNKGCFPRFPLQGKPGKVAGCQFEDPGEPAWDAFDCMADEDKSAITRVLVNFGKAIAAYESTLILRQTPFDRWITDVQNGVADESNAITDQAKRGARLFVGKAACNQCHNTALMSDNLFHNAGVEQIGRAVPLESDCYAGNTYCDCAPASDTHPGPSNCIPWGARDGIEKLQASKTRRDLIWSDDTSDSSRLSFVRMDLDLVPKGSYRTPGLRNVALTAPYMHNGSIASLEEVIAHYVRGGSSNVPGARDASMKPLFLSDSEQEDLVAFLKALTADPMPADLVAPPVLP